MLTGEKKSHSFRTNRRNQTLQRGKINHRRQLLSIHKRKAWYHIRIGMRTFEVSARHSRARFPRAHRPFWRAFLPMACRARSAPKRFRSSSRFSTFFFLSCRFLSRGLDAALSFFFFYFFQCWCSSSGDLSWCEGVNYSGAILEAREEASARSSVLWGWQRLFHEGDT